MACRPARARVQHTARAAGAAAWRLSAAMPPRAVAGPARALAVAAVALLAAARAVAVGEGAAAGGQATQDAWRTAAVYNGTALNPEGAYGARIPDSSDPRGYFISNGYVVGGRMRKGAPSKDAGRAAALTEWSAPNGEECRMRAELKSELVGLRRGHALLEARADGRPRMLPPLDGPCCPRDALGHWARSVYYMSNASVSFALVPKSASSSLKVLLKSSFGSDLSTVRCCRQGRPPDDVLRACILRDPVERFISGFYESMLRAMARGGRTILNRGKRFIAAANAFLSARWLYDDVVVKYDSIDAFMLERNGAAFKEALERYALENYDPMDPLDAHMLPQAVYVASRSDGRGYDFVGYVDTLDDDYDTFLSLAGLPPFDRQRCAFP